MLIFFHNFDRLLAEYKKRRQTQFVSAVFGADNRIRTGDLILTKDVLCLLSHISTYGDPERARTVDLQRDRLAF